jgi:hypothetical protein
MPRLRIAELTTVSPRHLDWTLVERYGEILDQLPPIVVFDTSDGLLVADGYHRIQAAKRRGDQMIDAAVTQGSRQDALEYAARINAISREELLAHIRRLHPEKWGQDSGK